MFIIKSNYEDIGLVGYWSGTAWSHKKSGAMRYTTKELADKECREKFSWLSARSRSVITVVEEKIS